MCEYTVGKHENSAQRVRGSSKEPLPRQDSKDKRSAFGAARLRAKSGRKCANEGRLDAFKLASVQSTQ